MRARCWQSVSRSHHSLHRSILPPHPTPATRSLSTTAASSTFTVNNRTYRMPPAASHTVGILVDGSAIDYLDAASAAGCMPHYNRLLNRTTFTPASPPSHPNSTHKYTPYFNTTSPGSQWAGAAAAQLYRASGAMPSYTNPNNVSVITGVPPRVHGIAGNFYYDRTAQREVMMNDPAMIRCDSILAAAEQHGARVTVLTVKDKLRRLLTRGLQEANLAAADGGRHVSIEKLDEQSLPGVDVYDVIRDVYEPMCSISALQLGVSLIKRNIAASSANSPPHIYYFSTTDYVQHKAAPGHPLANAFYAGLDGILGQLAELPVPVRFAFTADHGMSAKARDNGEPRVVYLSDVLEQHYPNGGGDRHDQWRVILPITDPHPRHHGALGGYATVYLTQPITPQMLGDVCGLLRRQRGVYTAMSGAEAAVALELPLDRIGDIVVLADRDWAVGKSKADHAASLAEMEKDRRHNMAREGTAGEGGLRSHGGLDEMAVPLFISDASGLDAGRRKRLMQGKGRNYDMFDVLLNGSDDASNDAQSAARESQQ